MTGYRAEELIGQPAARLYTPEDVAAGVPAQMFQRARAEGRLEGEALRVRKDGTLFWADVEIVALRGEADELLGFGEIARDATKRRRVEADLRVRAEDLATILESIGDAVIVTDAEGRVTMQNAAAEVLTGFALDEARGRPLAEVFHVVDEHTRAPVEDPVARVLPDGAVGLPNHAMLIARDGTRRPIADSIAPIRDGGAPRGVVLVFRDQTEERAAERALRESEERFRLLVESSKDYAIFMLDPEGRVASWNTGAERIKGYRAGEIVGQHFSRFYLPVEVEAGKPARQLEVAAAEGRFEDEGFRVRKDGTLFWANVVITALRDASGALRGFGKVTRDLTERKRNEEHAKKLAAEQAAAAEAARAALYLANASAALAASLDREATLEGLAHVLVPTFADWCSIDLLEDGRIQHAAVAHVDPEKVELARELQRRHPPDLEGTFGVPNVLRTGMAEIFPEIPASMLSAVARDAEMRAILDGLGLRSAMVVPLAAHGRTLGALTLIRTSSDQRYGDKDLVIARDLGLRAGLAVDNAILHEEARRAIVLRDEFLSIAGHELRTPVTAVQLQLLALRRLFAKGSPDPVSIEERLDKTLASIDRFDAMVRDLLDVTRIAAGRLGLDAKDVDLTAVVREVVERFEDEAARAGSPLELRDRGPVLLRCDRARVDQVVTNLLSNAVKYGARKPVRVSVGKEGDRAVIVVQDRGIGIAPELHRRIFERFERGVSGRSFGGFGLGLWIAREIVLSHGGTIGVESAPGAGSTFRVEIPLAPPVAAS